MAHLSWSRHWRQRPSAFLQRRGGNLMARSGAYVWLKMSCSKAVLFVHTTLFAACINGSGNVPWNVHHMLWFLSWRDNFFHLCVADLCFFSWTSSTSTLCQMLCVSKLRVADNHLVQKLHLSWKENSYCFHENTYMCCYFSLVILTLVETTFHVQNIFETISFCISLVDNDNVSSVLCALNKNEKNYSKTFLQLYVELKRRHWINIYLTVAVVCLSHKNESGNCGSVYLNLKPE